MIKIINVQYEGGHCLRLRFEDDVEGVIDIAAQIKFDGIFKPMKDLDFFQRVRINRTWSKIEWPGKIDFDPEALYEEITGRCPTMEPMDESYEV